MLSVLTVTARTSELTALAKSLSRQRITRPVQWIVVDSHYPVKRNHLEELHRRYLARWQVIYGPGPNSWARENGFRFLASIRNESLLLAGSSKRTNQFDNRKTPQGVLCCPIDDDLTVPSSRYLEGLYENAKAGRYIIPPISFDCGGEAPVIRHHPNGNAATPFWLNDALELNGYDELLDANWPGTSTFEDVDLCFRLKATFDYKFVAGEYKRFMLYDAGEWTDLGIKTGVKCNHAIRIAGAPVDQGGGGFNWVTNEGVPGEWAVAALGGKGGCPWLHREHCTFLGKACQIDLNVARWGHDQLKEFLVSRPLRDMSEEWVTAGERRRQLVIGNPLTIELE